MKTKYPSIIGVVAIFMLVASFVVPANLVNPAPVEAFDPICQWDYVSTPQMFAGFGRDIKSPSEINKLAVGSDGATIWAVDTAISNMTSQAVNDGGLYKTTNGGISWGGSPFDYLVRDVAASLAVAADSVNYNPVWDVAIAPDDPNFVAVVLDDGNAVTIDGGLEVWVTMDGGTNWQDTNFQGVTPATLAATEIISCIDISMDYGGVRDIMVGTRTIDEGADGDIYVLKAPGFTAWTSQDFPLNSTTPGAGFGADVYAAKFSPTYVGDAAIVAIASPVGANSVNTYSYVGVRDLAVGMPTTDWTTYMAVEVRDPAGTVGDSPGVTQVVTADLELPSDFSGATSSLRRFYVSTDASDNTSTGIFRVDDSVVYELMDTQNMFTVAQGGKRISSIAYYGTYASGKLMAGEVRGYACTATVPTWFTDSPTTCPIPCWYPALKPTTGAAGIQTGCALGTLGYGNAQVAWRVDGALAFVGTSSAFLDAGGVEDSGAFVAGDNEWPAGYLTTVQYDESAFGISRNNGETWNQLSLIDTLINQFTDVAPSDDCTTVYLASINENAAADTDNCTGFDSVWRTSTNADVVAPLPALAIGSYWERVLCHVTEKVCTDTEVDHAILRLAPDKTDGQILFWAAGGTGAAATNSDAVMWTPDHGDYWAYINPRFDVQDLAAASSTLIYVLNLSGVIQKMPYTGTAWSSAVTSKETACSTAHTIAAYGDDYVLVGNSALSGAIPACLSKNAGESYGAIADSTGNTGNVHVAFDPAFADNSIFYVGFDGATGSIWRYQVGTSADYTDILGAGAFGSVHQPGYFGVTLAHTGGALYGAHTIDATVLNYGVERTLSPTGGLPKPGITWDCLNIFRGALSTTIAFTEEPWSLK